MAEPRQEELEAAFLAGVPPELRPVFEGWSELGSALASVLGEARESWPGVALDQVGFAAYLAERAAPPDEGAELPPYSGDLYLAWGCVGGDPAALAHFDRYVLDKTDRVLFRLGLTGADIEDIKQDLRARLLVAGDDAAPRLTRYQGSGPLVSWACAAAGRQALTMLRRRRPSAQLDEDVLAASDDPSLGVLRERHHREFKTAFQAAFAELEPRDRAVLRALLIDERSVGDIAVVYAIHRVTASRWIAKLRRSLLNGTRNRLRVALSLDEADLDSAMRLVDSQLDLSLVRLLDD